MPRIVRMSQASMPCHFFVCPTSELVSARSLPPEPRSVETFSDWLRRDLCLLIRGPHHRSQLFSKCPESTWYLHFLLGVRVSFHLLYHEISIHLHSPCLELTRPDHFFASNQMMCGVLMAWLTAAWMAVAFHLARLPESYFQTWFSSVTSLKWLSCSRVSFIGFFLFIYIKFLSCLLVSSADRSQSA